MLRSSFYLLLLASSYLLPCLKNTLESFKCWFLFRALDIHRVLIPNRSKLHQDFGGNLNNNQPIPETSFLGVLKQRLLSFIFRGIWNEESDQTMVSDGGMPFRLHSGHLGISFSFIILLGYLKLPSFLHVDNLSDLEFL